MLNDKPMKKACMTLMVSAFMMTLAILPAFAAEEGKDISPIIQERVKSIIDSVSKSNPDAQNCKITVTLDYARNIESKTWRPKVFNVATVTEETPEVNSEVDYEENVELDDESTESNKEEKEEPSGSKTNMKNIIFWILSIIIVGILVKLFLPSLKKHMPKESSHSSSANNRGHNNSSSGASGWNRPGTQNAPSSPTPRQGHPATPNQKAEPQEYNLEEQNESSVKTSTLEKTIPSIEEQAEETIDIPEPKRVAPKPVVRYGQIAVMSQDDLITESAYMSEDEAGMPFEFTFVNNMAEGTYDIAPSARNSFLRDIRIITPYVQAFEAIPNPKMIKTISKGKLRKNGMQWVITEKAKIELQ